MNTEQLATFKQELIQACDAHIASGGTLMRGTFGNGDNCKCPLSCLIPRVAETTINISLSEKLGFVITYDEVWGFIYGFDRKTNEHEYSIEAYRLGQELANKYGF